MTVKNVRLPSTSDRVISYWIFDLLPDFAADLTRPILDSRLFDVADEIRRQSLARDGIAEERRRGGGVPARRGRSNVPRSVSPPTPGTKAISLLKWR